MFNRSQTVDRLTDKAHSPHLQFEKTNPPIFVFNPQSRIFICSTKNEPTAAQKPKASPWDPSWNTAIPLAILKGLSKRLISQEMHRCPA
jgi:hypothetical protein